MTHILTVEIDDLTHEILCIFAERAGVGVEIVAADWLRTSGKAEWRLMKHEDQLETLRRAVAEIGQDLLRLAMQRAG